MKARVNKALIKRKMYDCEYRKGEIKRLKQSFSTIMLYLFIFDATIFLRVFNIKLGFVYKTLFRIKVR